MNSPFDTKNYSIVYVYVYVDTAKQSISDHYWSGAVRETVVKETYYTG